MNLIDIKAQLNQILRNHYAFDQFEFDDLFKDKFLKEIDMDSIALLELYLVIEEGFNLDVKLSDRLDTQAMMDSKVEELLDAISMEILKIYRDSLRS